MSTKSATTISTDREVWELVMAKGRKLERKVTHGLDRYALTTIMATADFFSVCDTFLKQMQWDLYVAQYKIFDWIAMLLNGRHRGYPNEYIPTQQLVTRVMADAYLKDEVKNVKDFIQVLREVDYQLTEPMEIKFTSWSNTPED